MSSVAGFPAAYVDSFIRMISNPSRNIEVITYGDLNFGNDWDYENAYPDEWASWQESFSNGHRDPEKIYLVLHHDVDDSPERTHRLLEVEEKLGIRSSTFIFNRPVNRSLLNTSGEVEYVDYSVDIDLFKRLQEKGWDFCYHSNAFEQSSFEAELAGEIFANDIKELTSKGLNIDFFCPHGGAKNSKGESNVHFGIPEGMKGEVRWVLNRNTIKLNGVTSDGGYRGRDNWDSLDFRNFVRSWKPGRRYRILIHPQHYDDDFTPFEPMLLSQEWYRQMVDLSDTDFADWWPR